MVVFNNRIILQQKANGNRGASGSRSDDSHSQPKRMQQNISIPGRGAPVATGDKFKIEIFRETEVDQNSDMPLEGYVSVIMMTYNALSNFLFRDTPRATLTLFNDGGDVFGHVFCLIYDFGSIRGLLYR